MDTTPHENPHYQFNWKIRAGDTRLANSTVSETK